SFPMDKSVLRITAKLSALR
ncbi:putative nitrilase/cyanide hydratase and apolipoprotein N-acyltransferase, partial [Vibrio parahaemolyticus V-223/04]